MSEKFQSYREASKADDGEKVEVGFRVCNDQLKLGAILRIADATEVMAKDHQLLIDERDDYQRWYKDEQRKAERLRKQIAGLRGYITRLKKGRCRND